MELSELEQKFVERYNMVEHARAELAGVVEKVIAARTNLEFAKTDAILSGKIDGKNETERKTQLAALTATQAFELDCAEKEERAARSGFDSAMFSWDLLRYRLHIAEIAAKQTA